MIAPSALSLFYTKSTIDGYSREQFLDDLINEAEKDIRKCFDSGAHSIQLDFTEARYSLKADPTGKFLREFIDINNRVLDRFDETLRARLAVHICPGKQSIDTRRTFLLDARVVQAVIRIVAILRTLTIYWSCQRCSSCIWRTSFCSWPRNPTADEC